jgi:hypothetical protein
LHFFGTLAGLAEPNAFTKHLDKLRRIDWVVYAKPPFAGPERVLAYLARYTHRVAIANSRLLSLDDHNVRFSWKDYRQNGKSKVMTLGVGEFIRRFLLHTLPDGFHRIRHYGFLANGERSTKIELCRHLLDSCKASTASAPPADLAKDVTALSCCATCPECGGTMRRTATIPMPPCYPKPFHCDTS